MILSREGGVWCGFCNPAVSKLSILSHDLMMIDEDSMTEVRNVPNSAHVQSYKFQYLL